MSTTSVQLAQEAWLTFGGLDLHKPHIMACALDDSGTGLAEARQLSVSRNALNAFLLGRAMPITVAMEATLY